jgi:sugar lactone lactonase YvrE
MQYRQIRVISGKGSQPDQFSEALNGIAVDAAGAIYAVGDRQVKVFDADGGLQRRWSTERPGYCVAIDADSSIFVGQAGQIEKFDRTGALVTTWRDPERLEMVTGIGFHGENILVADAKGRCIRKYDRGGQWLSDIGKDNRTKGFLVPNGCLNFGIDEKGIIHAANPGKHRIERYTLSGEMVGRFGRFGTHRPEDFPGCCNPTNLTLTPQARLVVTEKAPPRVKVYSTEGEFLALIGTEFFDPVCKNMAVSADAQGCIYIVDTVHLNIHVFAPEKPVSGRSESSETEAMGGVGKP